MGPKQDPHDDRQLEQRDERDTEQRVLERGDHALGARCGERAMLPDAGRAGSEITDPPTSQCADGCDTGLFQGGDMGKLGSKLREEIEKILPPAIFFFTTLHIVALVRALMLKGTGIPVMSSLAVTVAPLPSARPC
jgi:hypothetical protein